MTVDRVMFAAIATDNGLARSTLYRNAALRAIIEQHQRPTDGPQTSLTDEIATLRAAVNQPRRPSPQPRRTTPSPTRKTGGINRVAMTTVGSV
jgi:hypothetical protein